MEKSGGRKPGVKNKLGAFTKEEAAKVFDALGGTIGFTQWARQNPTEFYVGFMARSMPRELDVSGNITHEFDFDRAIQTFESALDAIIRARGTEEENYPQLIEGRSVRGPS